MFKRWVRVLRLIVKIKEFVCMECRSIIYDRNRPRVRCTECGGTAESKDYVLGVIGDRRDPRHPYHKTTFEAVDGSEWDYTMELTETELEAMKRVAQKADPDSDEGELVRRLLGVS